MSYVGAPYNFVPLGKKVYRKDEITKHSEISGLSGYLEYQVTAKTPIIVDGGDKHFYKNKDGKAAIPGSTMRGLVRSNMQILSQSSVVDDIADGRMMYRCVGRSKNSANIGKYKEVLSPQPVTIRFDDKNKTRYIPQTVKGGYIKNENGKYYIIPSHMESTAGLKYFIISEKDITTRKIKGSEMLCEERRLQFKNEEYHPYTMDVYYRASRGGNTVEEILKTFKEGYKKGSIISSGCMKNKKVFYIIPEQAQKDIFEIPKEDVDSFKRDYEGRKKQFSAAVGRGGENKSKQKLIKEAQKFYALPEDGETKPIFYIIKDGKCYFGYTPYLRIFYKNSIYDGISKVQKDNSLDYCKSLFGFAGEKESYRSRLSFQQAVIDNEISENGKTTVVLGEPKPTSYLDYLINNGKAASYNDAQFSIRGVKQYWLHTKETAGVVGNNKEVGSDLYSYPKGTSFTGRIRFTNLSEEELGMLLWSLLLEKNSQQNIGKGKPYGFGRVEISLKQLKVLDTDAMYASEALCLEPYRDWKEHCEEYVEKAKKDMTRFLGKDVMSVGPIKAFFSMKDKTRMPREDRIQYMPLSEYQERVNKKIRLDTVEEVLEKENFNKNKYH